MNDTKTKLLDAAERVARAKGHNGFSYADLSVAVGIRKASIHHHFPTKADLLATLMKRYREEIAAIYANISVHHMTAAGQLSAFLDIHRAALNNTDTLCLCIALSAGRDGLDGQTNSEVSAFRYDTLAWLENVFQLGLSDGSISAVTNPSAEAAATLALAEGAQVSARAAQSMAHFDAAVALLRGRIS